MNAQANIEIFHLLFLRLLEGKLDKNLYSLKGGCNLRFFFKSIRYSEDIDFDVAIVSKQTLENKINKIFSSIDFKRILQSKQIEIAQYNPVKQAETTQRWKIQLRISNSSVLIPTKVEFSRRKLDKGIEYSAIDRDVINQYNLYPIICNHYNIEAAFLQKVNALIYRTETQARDVFDLKWLIDRGINIEATTFSKSELANAIKNAENISFSDFKGQVIVYLMDDYKTFYDSEENWNEMRTHVITTLQRLSNASN